MGLFLVREGFHPSCFFCFFIFICGHELFKLQHGHHLAKADNHHLLCSFPHIRCFLWKTKGFKLGSKKKKDNIQQQWLQWLRSTYYIVVSACGRIGNSTRLTVSSQ
mmetsp:Transcript_37019/g.60604  ORF Transcript_37019/g.60604 Transcript_37019/m.60604 type:complete len:106 (-) Transcript_37019:1035-1352(-)